LSRTQRLGKRGRYATASVLCIMLLAALTGCDSLRHYAQAISGQIGILNKRRPIHSYLDDPQTPPKLKQKLSLILELREFAKSELHL
jgi:predicted aminopeptidase